MMENKKSYCVLTEHLALHSSTLILKKKFLHTYHFMIHFYYQLQRQLYSSIDHGEKTSVIRTTFTVRAVLSEVQNISQNQKSPPPRRGKFFSLVLSQFS